MVLTDGVHVVASTLDELHAWANQTGIKRCWFEGVRRGHPHYDLPKRLRGSTPAGAQRCTTRELVQFQRKQGY